MTGDAHAAWVFCALTNNTGRGRDGNPAPDAANPRADNTMGSSILLFAAAALPAWGRDSAFGQPRNRRHPVAWPGRGLPALPPGLAFAAGTAALDAAR